MRPVHYNGSGLAFDCYWSELKVHLRSSYQEPAQPGHSFRRTKYAAPNPLRHANLRKVTCPTCWREIRKLAGDAPR